jgi:hypothetical protein
MRHLASILLSVASALWLGGLITLFILVQAVFKAVPDRALAGQSTSAMFVIFGQYQLFIAAAALVGAFLGYIATRRNIFVVAFALYGLAALGAAFLRMHVIPRMEGLRLSGANTSPAFKKLHGQSIMIFTAMAALLLIATALVPFAARSERTTDLPTEAEY